MKTKIWGKGVSEAILRNWKKLVLLLKIETNTQVLFRFLAH